MVVQSTETPAIDNFVQRWVEYCAGGLSVSLVYLGEHLGLFTSLRDDGPATVEELSSRTGLVERYVREWLAAHGNLGPARLFSGRQSLLLEFGTEDLLCRTACATSRLCPMQ